MSTTTALRGPDRLTVFPDAEFRRALIARGYSCTGRISVYPSPALVTALADREPRCPGGAPTRPRSEWVNVFADRYAEVCRRSLPDWPAAELAQVTAALVAVVTGAPLTAWVTIETAASAPLTVWVTIETAASAPGLPPELGVRLRDLDLAAQLALIDRAEVNLLEQTGTPAITRSRWIGLMADRLGKIVLLAKPRFNLAEWRVLLAAASGGDWTPAARIAEFWLAVSSTSPALADQVRALPFAGQLAIIDVAERYAARIDQELTGATMIGRLVGYAPAGLSADER